MKAGKVLLGLVTGAVAGITAGVLFAPKKGKDTRKAIADGSEEYLNDAKGKVNGAKDSLDHKLESLKAKGKSMTSDNKTEEIANDLKAKAHDELS